MNEFYEELVEYLFQDLLSIDTKVKYLTEEKVDELMAKWKLTLKKELVEHFDHI